MPAWPARTAWWSPERWRLLDEYTRLAEESRRQGRLEAAVAYWEEALTRLPNMPQPRRRHILRCIQETLEEAARRALQKHAPDMREARRHLEHAVRAAGDPAVMTPLGWLVHLAGDPAAALRWYERAAAAGDASRALEYGRRLARLQLATPRRGARGLAGTAAVSDPAVAQAVAARGWTATSAAVRNPASPGWTTAGTAAPAPAPHPLETAAWRRLDALSALAEGDAPQALARFPRHDDPSLPEFPAPWAQEGALLAALNGDWRACLAYYRRAQSQGAALMSGPHPYVFAAAWLCTDDGSGEGVPFFPAALRERAPKELFVDDAQYRAWRRQFVRWQYRWWLVRARAALQEGDDARLQESLAAAVRLLPRERLSKALQAWLACAYGGARPPDDAAWDWEGRRSTRQPAAYLRLGVWAAERFGAPADVIRRLNVLLDRYPQDPWGLVRWKRWMLNLGQEAMAQGRWRQALLQFVSLLLRLPEDDDGWRWCGRLHADLGNAARAADCLAQAERLSGRGRRWFRLPAPIGGADQGGGSAANPGAAAADGDTGIEYGLLEELLAQGEEAAAVAVAPCFAPKALTQAVWASVRGGDVYLAFLLKGWARRAGSVPSRG